MLVILGFGFSLTRSGSRVSSWSQEQNLPKTTQSECWGGVVSQKNWVYWRNRRCVSEIRLSCAQWPDTRNLSGWTQAAITTVYFSLLHCLLEPRAPLQGGGAACGGLACQLVGLPHPLLYVSWKPRARFCDRVGDGACCGLEVMCLPSAHSPLARAEVGGQDKGWREGCNPQVPGRRECEWVRGGPATSGGPEGQGTLSLPSTGSLEDLRWFSSSLTLLLLILSDLFLGWC